MKDILFRGKIKDSGKWIEGYYAKAKDYLTGREMHVIFPLDLTIFPHSEFSSYEEIIPETLGRYIDRPCYDGLNTNQRIFQGDIIRVWRYRFSKSNVPDVIAIVVDENCITEKGFGRWFPQDTTRIEVIGNVHDNPEMVGEKYADQYKFYHCISQAEPWG